MPTDGPEDQLVTIRPLLACAPAEPEYRPWLGPLLIVGVPIAVAVGVFVFLVLR